MRNESFVRVADFWVENRTRNLQVYIVTAIRTRSVKITKKISGTNTNVQPNPSKLLAGKSRISWS